MIKYLYLILCCCHFSLQAQVISQNYIFQNISSDTSVQLNVGGFVDGKNSEYLNLYYTLGINGSMSYNYRTEPAKAISLSNNNNFEVKSLSLITNNRGNWYEIDSLKKEIINPLSVTPKDKIIDIFNFTSENIKYWFDVDQNSNSQFYLTNLLTNYGLGHCGHYSSATSLIGYATNNNQKNQKIYLLNGSAHAFSGISIDSSKYFAVDSDHDAYYLNYDNSSLATIDDIQVDNYLFHRTKHYGKIFPFSPQINTALILPLINSNYTTVSTDFGFNYNGKTGNSSTNCYFSLRPTETISFYPRDTAVQYHQVNTINYGVNPNKNDVKYSIIGNGDFVLNPNYNNTDLSSIFANSSNLQKASFAPLDTSSLKLINTNIKGEAILKMNAPFVIINGDLTFNTNLNQVTDTFSIEFSKDSILWVPVFSSSLVGPNIDSVNFKNLIQPDSSIAINEYFVRFNLVSNNINSYFKLIKSSCLFQCSKSFIPRLQIGDNTIRIKSKAGVVPQGMELKIHTLEDYSNHVPNSPNNAIFPPHNSVVDSTNFTFHWNVPTDPDGNVIQDYHFQLSEFPDFRRTVCTNFDQMFLLKNYPYGITLTNNLVPNFKSDFSGFLQNNKTYYWRVRASDQLYAWSSWSPTWSFTTQIPMMPYNAHFELTNNVDSLALTWKVNPLGILPSQYVIHASNLIRGFTPVDSNILNNTIELSKKIKDTLAYKFYRIAALDTYGIPTTPTPIVNFPTKSNILINDSVNLAALFLSTKPFGYDRFALFDTAFFNLFDNRLIPKKIGKTIYSICRSIGADTIYDKQVIANINCFSLLSSASPNSYVCDSNKAQITFQLQGVAPFSINYTKDGIANSFLANQIQSTHFFSNGNYIFQLATDAAGCTSLFGNNAVQNINYNALSENHTNAIYNCSTDSSYITYNFTGDAPYLIHFSKNGITDSFNAPLNSIVQTITNGNYIILDVVDAKNCSKIINDSLIVNAAPLAATINNNTYVCDSNKAQIIFSLQGNAPFTIHYTQDGSLQSFSTSDTICYKNFINGNYVFQNVIDSTGCSAPIFGNVVQAINYNLLSENHSSPVYDCDSNSSFISFALTGNPPYTINYIKNAIPQQLTSAISFSTFYFDNGNYQFQNVMDATGCTKIINQNFSFNFDTIDIAVSIPQYDCDSNKTKIHFDLQGNSPWTIDYTKNGLAQQINTNSASFDHFFGNGVYQISQVSDSTNCMKSINHFFVFNYDTIDFNLAPPVYNCDSSKTAIQFNLQGNPPFTINYTRNAIAQQIVTINNNSTQYFNNGNFVFQNVMDATGCTKIINQNFSFNFDTIDIAVSIPQYDCDSNKTKIHFDLQGNSPWTIDYTKNGLAQQINTNSASFDHFFGNGVYQISQVSDSTNCMKSINHFFVFNYDTIDFNLAPPVYNCDSNKTAIQFNLQGNPPFTINYTRNAIAQQIVTINNNSTQYFNNGNFVFQNVVDATGCTKIINQNFSFNFDTLDIALGIPQYNCDSIKTKIHFDLQGNSPWTIDYTKNGLAQQINTNSASFDHFFGNGVYQISQVSDATNCMKSINHFFVFNYDTIDINLTAPVYHCDSNKTAIQFNLQGNPPFTINYTRNAIAQQIVTINNNSTQYFNNGNFVFQNVVDATGCTKIINQNFSFNFDTIDIALGIPQYNCDSIKTKIHFDLQGNSPWTIDYTKNGLAQQINSNSASFDHFFGNGVYLISQVSDATNCMKSINQFFVFNYDTIDFNLAPPVYHCDSNKTAIQFNLQGNPPFTINYTRNAIAQQIVTNNNNSTQYFNNGNFVFQNVVDATGCTKIINQNFSFNFDTLDIALGIPQYNCDSIKTKIHFDLQGNSPWTIDYTKNGLAQQINTNSASFDYFFGNGVYLISQVSDATNCMKSINQFFVFNYDTIDFNLAPPVYNCDSNKTAIQFNLQGNPPFTINYTQNAIAQQIVTINNNSTQYFNNGNFVFQNVVDATGCSKIINQNFSFNFDTLDIALGIPQYNCDSIKTKIHFDLQGNSPWTIDYTKNGLAQQINSNSASFDYFFGNGVYQISQVSDATNCMKSINQFFVFNYDTIDFNLAAPVYNCDSNKTAIQFNLQGNPPFTINYTQNAIAQQIVTINNNSTQYFNNGNFVFQNVMDATGCIKNINQIYFFNYDTIDYVMSAPQYYCDSNKTKIHFSLQGNSPWIIDYKKDGAPLQIIANSANFDLFYSNGLYQFIQIKDATNCIKNINQAYSFNYEPVNAIITQQQFDCDSNKYKIDLFLQGNSPWTISYNNGGQFFNMVSNLPNTSLLLPNGNWTITKVKDATNCEQIINFNKNINYAPINAITSVPVYDCDSNKMRVNFSLTGTAPWNINYTLQTIPPAYYSIQTNNPTYSLYFDNGSYLITQVTDSNNCAFEILESVNNNYTPLGVQKNPEIYNCDSTKMMISYSFTGDAPYKLTYKNNGNAIIYQLNSVVPLINFYLGDGSYTIISANDVKCSKLLNDSIVINYPKLISNISPSAISCDSDKVYVQFSTPQGNKPFTYFYYYNNQYLNFTTFSNSTDFYLNNGQYFFEKVVDSMGCAVNFNQIVNANYTPYSYTGFSNKYICEKDSTELTFDVSITTKVYIAYTFNGGPIDSFIIAPNTTNTFILPNGSYTLLSISDSIGCLQNINKTFIIDNEPVNVNYSISRNCDKREYSYLFDIKGTAPWTLHYNYRNIARTAIINNSPFTWNIDPGTYFIEDLTDSNGCAITINKMDTLQSFLADFPTLYYNENWLHTITTPFNYYWYKDDILIDSMSKVTIPSYGNGIYKVQIIDSLGCSNWSNEITLGYPTNINVFPNPVSSSTHIVISDDFGDTWSYQLFDATGKLLQEKTLAIPSADIEMNSYSSGVYSLIVQFGNQSIKNKNVIRLIKK